MERDTRAVLKLIATDRPRRGGDGGTQSDGLISPVARTATFPRPTVRGSPWCWPGSPLAQETLLTRKAF
jgi:hypothetical protein